MAIASEYVTSRDRRRRRRRRRIEYGEYGEYDHSSPDDDATAKTNTCLSLLQKWYVNRIEEVGIDAWEAMSEYNVTSLAYYYKHHVSDHDGTTEYFGRYGERTELMMGNHRDMKSFWYNATRTTTTTNATTTTTTTRDDVVLLGMHGSELLDENNLLYTLMRMHDIDDYGARFLMERIREIISSLPDGYDNPLLTANAMAIRSIDRGADMRNVDGGIGDGKDVDDDGSAIPRREERNSIIVGDGIFDFLSWLSLDTVPGVSYIHSHEYGHHVQYDLGVNEVLGDGSAIPEATRWWEMMADAYGSYYIGHVRGGDMEDDASLHDVHRTAYSLGDCESSIGTHHGLPRQRECASNYGSYLASLSHLDDGRILPSSVIRDMFNENYESMVRLDDGFCVPVVVDDGSLDDPTMYGHDGNGGEYSSYFANVANYHLEMGMPSSSSSSSYVQSEGDKPPPILKDENGTVLAKEEEGFWGMTIKWVPAEERHASSAAVECSGVILAFAVLSIAYASLLR